MKTITTKKLFTCLPASLRRSLREGAVGMTFILLMSGMFSFTVADAQCPGNKVRVYHCYQGNAWNHVSCRSKCVDPNNIPLYWFPGDCHPNPCNGGDRLANEQTDGELFSLDVSPNPVSGSSVIYFFLEESQNVSLNIYDVNGRLVSTLADKIFEEGENEIVWDAAEVNAGIYYLRMETMPTGRQAAVYSKNQKLIVTK